MEELQNLERKLGKSTFVAQCTDVECDTAHYLTLTEEAPDDLTCPVCHSKPKDPTKFDNVADAVSAMAMSSMVRAMASGHPNSR